MQAFFKGYTSNEVALGILRAFTGGALLVKGVNFMMNMHELYDLTAQALPYSSFMLAHLIVFAHVVGGFCLLIGLLGRLAAASNIPIILGAILFVHAKEGLFAASNGLELTVMLLVVLSVLTYTEAKFMSIDTLLDKSFKRLEQDKKYQLQHKHEHAA